MSMQDASESGGISRSIGLWAAGPGPVSVSALRRLESAYESAMACAESERESMLAAVAREDPAVHRRLVKLLAVQSQMGDFLSNHTVDWSAIAPPAEIRAEGEWIGPYRLEKRLGEGGFGVVHLARQEEPIRREVAIKVMRAQGAAMVARFEAERQMLAMLDHPHIAKIFDAGTTGQGLLYYVMEYVDGRTLTAFCEENGASVQERLRLFVQVLQAVQHAHVRGVVHRDIKPGNVLVRDGHARVIDFGIAKMMESNEARLAHTIGLQVLGTPEYMSPEQVEASPAIDARTDIYSLGCLLYELLTGVTPFAAVDLRSRGLASLRALVCETTAVRPSQRMHEDAKRKALEGDLDWIVMRAMEKEPSRRYQTAREFLLDIQAHLEHTPVAAAPPGRSYLVRKFCRRHRAAVVLACCAAGVLVAGIATTSAAMARAQKSRATAAVARERGALDAYAANIRAAESALSAGDVQRAGAALEACETSLRGPEWHMLHARCDQSAAVLRGHTGRVVGVVYSPSGDSMLSWDADGAMMLWEGDAHEPTRLQRHTGEVRRVVFTPDGQRAVSASMDSMSLVSDVATGSVLMTLAGHSAGVDDVAVSSDGKLIATGSHDGTAKVWDATTGACLHTLRGATGTVRRVAFRGDDAQLATGGDDGTVRLWDPTSGELVGVLGGLSNDALEDVTYSPDGTKIATGTRGGAISLWDVASRTPKAIGKFEQQVYDCEFSPDGTRLAVAGGTVPKGEVRLWKLDANDETVELVGHMSNVYVCRFSLDGALLATGCVDKSVRVWDARTGALVNTLWGHREGVVLAAFDPRGSDANGYALATSGGDSTVRVWDDVSQPKGRLVGHSYALRDARMNAMGTRISSAALDGTARVWDASTQRELLRLDHAGDMAGTTPGVYTSAFSPDDAMLLTTGQDGFARVWDANDGMLLSTLRGHTAAIMRGEFLPDGFRVVTAGYDGWVRMWDARSGAELVARREHLSRIREMQLSGDGRMFATVGDDARVCTWDAKDGTLRHKLTGHERAITALAVSDDGQMVASGSDDRTAIVWDAASGAIIARCAGHTDAVIAVELSSDGSTLFSGSADATVRVWDTRTGTLQWTLSGHGGPVRTIVELPQHRVATGSLDGTVRAWCLRTGRELATVASEMATVRTLRLSPDGAWLLASGHDRTVRVLQVGKP
jgi:WD40 repeat protein/predicted Ser/Thr protein kinase